MSRYIYFVGIDVSKQHLDDAIVQDGKVLEPVFMYLCASF